MELWCISAADVLNTRHGADACPRTDFPASRPSKGSGASRRVLEKARASRMDVGNLESLLKTCVHWQPLVSV